MATKAIDVNNPPAGGFQEGGWYWDPKIGEARQYNKNTGFGAGTTVNDPNAAGYGQRVSQEVQNASAALQGKVITPTVPTAVPGGTTTPTFTPSAAPVVPQLQDIYDTALKGSGYAEATEAMNTAQEKINEVTAALDKETSKINENPYLSEATRVGRINRLKQIANADVVKYQNDLSLAQGKTAQAQADAKLKVDLANGQYSINRQTYQDNLSTFNSLLSSGALTGASEADIASLAASTGVSTSMIKSAISTTGAKDTQLVTSTNDAGVVTATLINTRTGAIVKKTSLGAIGNAQNGTKTTEADKQAYYTEAIRTAVTQGKSVKDIFATFSGLIDPNTILSIYNANTTAETYSPLDPNIQKYIGK